MLSLDSALGQLTSIDWFSRSRQRDAVASELSLQYVASWKDAIRLCGRVSTANAFQEACGILTRELGIRFRQEFRKWNATVDNANAALEASVLPRVDSVIEATTDIGSVEHGVLLMKRFVRWDLVSYLMEQASSDLVKPRFYTEVLAIYQSGHFPCGWDEQWPHGRIWLY